MGGLTKVDKFMARPRGMMGYTHYDRMVIYAFLALAFGGLILL